MANRLPNYFIKNANNKYMNCTVNVIGKKNVPFVINETEGFEIDILRTIGSRLNINFNVTIVPKNVKNWGEKVNKTWTGIIKKIYYNSYLGVGNIDIGMIVDSELDYSRFYHMETLVFVVPIALQVPRWRILTVIFTTAMWGVCLATIVFFALAFYLSASHETGEADHSLLTAFQVIICHPVHQFPRSDVHKVFFIGLSLISIILSSIYTCSLIKNLKNHVREHQISEASELFGFTGDLRYRLGGMRRYQKLFESNNSKETRAMFENYETISKQEESVGYWLKQVGNERDLWTISSKHYVKYLIAKDSKVTTTSCGMPKVYPFKKPLSVYSIGLMARQGHLMIKPINTVIDKMFSSGVVLYCWEKYRTFILKGESMDDRINVSVEPLTLEHLQGAFAMLMFGYTSGFFIIILEVICRKSNLIRRIRGIVRSHFNKIVLIFRKNKKKTKKIRKEED